LELYAFRTSSVIRTLYLFQSTPLAADMLIATVELYGVVAIA
jgi:hypothetical protein